VWSFAVIGHPRSEDEEVIGQPFEQSLQLCQKNKVDIVFLGGDNILGYNTSFRRYKRDVDTLVGLIDSINIPVFVVPGNHDYCTREQKQYFEMQLNKSYMRITREVINFLLLDTIDGHLDVFDGRQFQMRYHKPCTRRYYFEPIPRNSGWPIPFSDEQYALFEKTLCGGEISPLPDDKFELPPFYGIIMCHPVWKVDGHDWNKRFHPHLIGRNAFVFCGDHQTSNPEYVIRDGVHYINTAISSNIPSFVIGRFYKKEGLFLSEETFDGQSKPMQFKRLASHNTMG
jgi:hypothetical protein